MSTHPLDPLLRPKAVAVVGASGRGDSMGEWSLTNLIKGGYRGSIYPVNPGYEELQGYRCYATLGDLPEVPEMVIFAVGDARLEAVLDEAVALGVPAAVMMSSLVIDGDTTPRLRDRVHQRIQESGMLVCGANGMGFYNVRDHVWACGFDSRTHEAPGNVSLISHSGSGMCGIVDTDRRLRFNFAVSTGNEIGVTMDAYLDFVLDLPETRAVGLFIETARNPERFCAALDKSAQKDIPVVALKVGRTEQSAMLTVSHSGAMAGDDATYDALFDRYGVHRVRDMDELATALILFAEMGEIGDGGLVTLHDSGGERQLIVDLADEAGVPLTPLGQSTSDAIAKIIDPELPAVNPLDGWSRGGPAARDQMIKAMSLLLQDEGAAFGAMILDRGPDGIVYPGYVEYMQSARRESGKPVALVASRQGTGNDELAVSATHAGYPVLDGVPAFLRGARALLDFRDFRRRETSLIESADHDVVTRWRDRLADGTTLSESLALGMLAEFGVPAVAHSNVVDTNELREAAARHGYPVALKCAVPDVHHKTEQGGVVLGIDSETELLNAYAEMCERLGPQALVSPMVAGDVEMLLGARCDPQFGPVVVLGFGGVLAEVLNDVAFALPPFDVHHARRCIDRLKLRPLLDGVRGKAPVDVDRVASIASRFSIMVDALRDVVAEIDVNPVRVQGGDCVAVDALVAGRRSRHTSSGGNTGSP